LSFYQESLDIVRKINDRRMIAVTLNNIGEIYADLGDYRKAAALHQEALPLRRAASDADGGGQLAEQPWQSICKAWGTGQSS